jgi:rubredoxin
MTLAKHYCPCCGFSELKVPAYRELGSPPWSNHGLSPYFMQYGEPSYEVCSCCGFEFGNDDNPGISPGQSFEDYRREWIASGAQWLDPEKRPEVWSLTEQFGPAGIISDA